MSFLDTDRMLEAIKKSGYLFEWDIIDLFEKKSFFIESNKVFEDRLSWKWREIDMIWEYYNRERTPNNEKCFAKTYVVAEIKNNNSPLVLLNKEKFSPNEETRLWIKDYVTIPNEINYDGTLHWENFNENNKKIFTQYCSFEQKKWNKDFMAIHPDIIYQWINKIAEYCEKMIEDCKIINEEKWWYLRHCRYLPVLIINDNLYELEKIDGEEILEKVDNSIYRFNYYYKNKPELVYIHVITKKWLTNFIDSIIKNDESIESKLITIRKKHERNNN